MLLQEPSSSLCDLHHTRCNLPHVAALVANRRYLSDDLAVGAPWPGAECDAAPQRGRSVRGLRTAAFYKGGRSLEQFVCAQQDRGRASIAFAVLRRLQSY